MITEWGGLLPKYVRGVFEGSLLFWKLPRIVGDVWSLHVSTSQTGPWPRCKMQAAISWGRFLVGFRFKVSRFGV